MSYRNAAELIAQVAIQSQSDVTNTTISKSALFSGVATCWLEKLNRDGSWWRLAQCTVGAVRPFTASSSCVDRFARRDDWGERMSSRLIIRGVSVPSISPARPATGYHRCAPLVVAAAAGDRVPSRWTGLAAIGPPPAPPDRTRIWHARSVSADGERIDGADKSDDELRLQHRSPADHPLWWSAIAQSSDADADQWAEHSSQRRSGTVNLADPGALAPRDRGE